MCLGPHTSSLRIKNYGKTSHGSTEIKTGPVTEDVSQRQFSQKRGTKKRVDLQCYVVFETTHLSTKIQNLLLNPAWEYRIKKAQWSSSYVPATIFQK